MTKTQITCEIDLNADGKHSGYLRIPHSVHRSAYGWLGTPIVSIRNGNGPVLLMLAGVHGDEYEGQIALTKLIRDLDPPDIRGQIILLTAANQASAEAGLRVSPVDDRNMNRNFPGDPSGTPTEMMAHYIEEVLLPRCDLMVDLHSGGGSLFYPATLLRGQGWTADEAATLKVLQEAFDLPYAWVFQGGGGPTSTARTAMGAANRKGVPSVMAELGGGGSVTRDILASTERGLRRILYAQGMLPGYQPDVQRGTRELYVAGSVYVYETGLFEPMKGIADPIVTGETVGLIHDPSTPSSPPIPVLSPHEGIVLAKRPMAQVRRGDAVFQIAFEVPSA